MKLSRLLSLAKGRYGVGMAIRLISVGSMFLVNILFARHLGPDGFGRLTFVMSWLLLMSGLIRTGLSNLLVREVASYEKRGDQAQLHGIVIRAFQAVFVLAAFSSALLAGIAILFGGLIGAEIRNLLLIGLPFVALIGFMGVSEAITRGFGNVIAGQMGEFFVRPVALLLIAAFLAFAPGILPLTPKIAILAYLCAAFLAALTSYLLRNQKKLAEAFSVLAIFEDRHWISSLTRLSLIAWLSMILLHVTPILVGILSSPAELGKFQVASQLAFLPSIMTVVVNTLLAPEMSRSFANEDYKQLQVLARRSCQLCLAFSLPVVLVYVVFGHQLISLLVGNEYDGLYAVLLVTSFGTFMNSLMGSVGILMIACRLESKMYAALASGLVSNVLSCFLLVPFFGALGGSLAVAISLGVWNILLVVRLKKATRVVSLPFARI